MFYCATIIYIIMYFVGTLYSFINCIILRSCGLAKILYGNVLCSCGLIAKLIWFFMNAMKKIVTLRQDNWNYSFLPFLKYRSFPFADRDFQRYSHGWTSTRHHEYITYISNWHIVLTYISCVKQLLSIMIHMYL